VADGTWNVPATLVKSTPLALQHEGTSFGCFCQTLQCRLGSNNGKRDGKIRTVLLTGLTLLEKTKQLLPSSQLGSGDTETFVTGSAGCITDLLLSGHGNRDALRGSHAENSGTITSP